LLHTGKVLLHEAHSIIAGELLILASGRGLCNAVLIVGIEGVVVGAVLNAGEELPVPVRIVQVSAASVPAVASDNAVSAGERIVFVAGSAA
jgi:hypothetical protein